MGVYIKGMKIPKKCLWCPLMDIGLCQVTKKDVNSDLGRRADDCPLVEVPEPHGDLIDRQKLLENNKHLEYPTDEKYRRDRAWAVGFNSGARHCNEHAVYAKTVIEAEGE